MCPRQNGKGSILEARELAGLFLLGESDLVHSAHLASTSTAHFERIVGLIENEPSFMSRVAKNGIRRANGEQGIRLKTGATLAFRTRTSGGARGLTGDFVALDEAMYLSNGMMGALFPIISAAGTRRCGSPGRRSISSSMSTARRSPGSAPRGLLAVRMA
jgi:hypothetical protein